MDRITVAFLLITLLALAMVAGIWARIHSSPERTLQRRWRTAKAARDHATGTT